MNALGNNTTGDANTALGLWALRDNTTGRDNTAVGHIALQSNTIGEFNTALGSGALQLNTTGNNNTAVGKSALTWNTTGNDNVWVGNNPCLSCITNHNQSTFVGAGMNITTSRTNVSVLGFGLTDAQFGAVNNRVLLGNTAITQVRANIAGGLVAHSCIHYSTSTSL